MLKEAGPIAGVTSMSLATVAVHLVAILQQLVKK